MSQNIIDLSWDLQKFDAQTQIVLKQMTEVYTSAKGISELKISPGSTGGYTELIGKTNELNKLHSKTIDLQKKAEQLEQQRLRTAKLKADADAAQLKATKAQIAADEALEKQKLRVAAANEKASKNNVSGIPFVANTNINTDELKNAKTLVNEVDLAEANAAMSASEFGNSLNKSTTALQTQGIQVKSNAADLAREAQIKKTLAQQEAQALKNSVREQIAAKGSLEQRRAALIRLTAAYDNLNVAERESAYGVRLQKVVAGVTTQVKELEFATGRAQRNVGNYGSAFGKIAKGATSAYNGLRKIAYLIPGIGIGGLVLLMVEPLTKLFNLLTKSTSATVTLAEKTRILGEVQEESVKGFGTAAAKIDLLKSKLDDLSISQADRLKYAKEYNLVADKGNKIDTTQLNNISLINAQMEAQIELLKQRAIALGATNVLAKKAEDVFNAQLTLSNDQAEFVDNKKLKTTLDNAQRILNDAAKKRGETNKLSAKEALAFIDLPDDQLQEVVKKNQSKFKILEDAGVKAQLQELATRAKNIQQGYAAVSSAGVGILKSDQQNLQDAQTEFDKTLKVIAPLITTDTFTKHTKDKKERTQMDSVKEKLDLEFELYKIAQQRKIKLLDDDLNKSKKNLDDKFIYEKNNITGIKEFEQQTFFKRVTDAENYRDAVIELAQKTADHEIAIDKEKIKTLEENQKKEKTKTGKANIQIEIDNANKQIKIEQAKLNDEKLAAQEDFNKRYNQITADDEADRLKIIELTEQSVKNVRNEQQSAIDTRQETELAGIDKLLSEKLISQENYNKRKAKLEKDALVLSLQSQITEEKGLRDIAILKGESVIEYDNKITSLTAKLQTAQGKKPKDKGPSLDESIEKTGEAILKTIDGLVDMGYQREIDAIQKIIDLNNYRKEQEIKAIGESTLSQQEKAAQMIVLDNEVAANNRKLQREQVAIQIKQAKFDRDTAILNILEQAAIAEFKLPAEAGFAGIAAGIAIGATAIGEIAMILARPLPSMPAYEKGTTNHPGGPAIVGEGKFKELVEEPSGRSFIADRPMLLNALPKGSKVTPLTKEGIMQSMYRSMIIATADMIQTKEKADTSIVDAIKEGSQATIQAMKRQKAPNVTFISTGNWQEYIRKNVLE